MLLNLGWMVRLWRGSVGVVAVIVIAISAGCARPSRPYSSNRAGAVRDSANAPSHAVQAGHLAMAADDPLRFLTLCRDQCRRNIKDYRCRLTKQERIGGRLGPVQEIDVRFRQTPFSVNFRWIKNAGRAKRANYVAGRWMVDGRDLALFVPSGILGLLAPAGVRRDVHGPDATRESRSRLTRFGYLNTLEQTLRTCARARNETEFKLLLVGERLLGDRPSYVFERWLPYDDSTGVGSYPDRVLVIYIDRAWLVPTACYAYADDKKSQLLGSYLLTDPRFNVGLTDADFAE